MSDRLLIKRNAIDLKEGLNSSDPYATVPGLDLLRAPSHTHQFNSIGAGRRNLVINGDFRVAQRGTSFPGNTGGAFTLDRWTSYIGEGTWDITRSTDAPPGHAYSFRWENASAFNAASAVHISHRIEASNCEQLAFGTDSPQPLTVSFWVKTSKIGRYNLEIDVYATDGTPWSRIPSFYVNNADVWEYKEITVLGASNFVNRTTEGTAGIGLNWWISAAGQFITGDDVSMERWDESGFVNSQRGYGVGNMGETANNFFMLAGVQCEVGPRATPFEYRLYGEELALCQRYYQILVDQSTHRPTFAARANSTSTVEFGAPLSVPIAKSNPTIIYNNYGIYLYSGGARVNDTGGSVTLNAGSHDTRAGMIYLKASGFSITDDRAYTIGGYDTDFLLAVDSEI